MTIWLTIDAAAAGTYGLRVSMFLILGDKALPSWAEKAMTYVSPAAVAALVASMVMTTAGRVTVPELTSLAAVTAGFLAVRRSGNVMHAFAVGLPVFWVFTALGW